MTRRRLLIGFLDYGDVFEDFYPHYGVDQVSFATRWAATANHAIVATLQREVGDVIWYALSLNPELGEERHAVTGCRVKLLRSGAAHRFLWRLFYLSASAWRWRRYYAIFATFASYLAAMSPNLFTALRRDRPDVLFLQDYATGRFDVMWLVARCLGVKLIAYHSGSKPAWYQAAAIKRWTIPRADRLIVSNREEGDMLVRDFGVHHERRRLILTPIDTEAFKPMDRSAACRIAGLDPGRVYVLFVGRLEDRIKRVGALIDCFKEAAEGTNAELLIAGDGPDAAALRDRAGGASTVRFLGWRSGAEQLAPLYAAAACLVLNSSSEGFPTVVGEAMACGTPVLATRVGGVPELVIDGETGWLIAPGDDAALGAKLAEVIKGQAGDTAMRARARAMAEQRVSPAAIGAQLRECFSIARIGDGAA